MTNNRPSRDSNQVPLSFEPPIGSNEPAGPASVVVEQFEALNMHKLYDKHPSRPGFELASVA